MKKRRVKSKIRFHKNTLKENKHLRAFMEQHSITTMHGDAVFETDMSRYIGNLIYSLFHCAKDLHEIHYESQKEKIDKDEISRRAMSCYRSIQHLLNNVPIDSEESFYRLLND